MGGRGGGGGHLDLFSIEVLHRSATIVAHYFFVLHDTYYLLFHVLVSCHNNLSLCREIVITYHLMCHFDSTHYYFMPEDNYYYHEHVI
jgi:hypothetical protein